MGLRDDLNSEVGKVIKTPWAERDGRVVPEDGSVGLGNDAVKIEATVLYADLADSTVLVDRYKPQFAAKIYKTFLHCAAKIIVSNGGVITAYDGDRIMAVFIGSAKNSDAARAALQINWAVGSVVQPALTAWFVKSDFVMKHVVGIDTSELFVAKTGIRGDNDLVWVGRAANHAAKMSALSDRYQTYISEAVFKKLNDDAKFFSGRQMWEEASWHEFDGRRIYRSNWRYEID